MARALLDALHEAAMSSSLSRDARHLVHVLARLSNGQTGRGTVGQATIARKMGCSERLVRRLMAELEAAAPTSVRLVRRPRFRAEGRGRTSDEWQLVLPAQHAGYSDDQPAQRAGGTDGLTGTDCTTNRHGLHDQPAQRAGDPRRDPRRSSDLTGVRRVLFRSSRQCG